MQSGRVISKECNLLDQRIVEIVIKKIGYKYHFDGDAGGNLVETYHISNE